MDLVKSVYISSACNKCNRSADWGRNGLIIYATCNAVGVYDTEYGGVGKVIATCYVCNERVTCVRWLRNENGSPESEFISTGADGSLIVWSIGENKQCTPSAILNVDDVNVNVADCIYLSQKSSTITIQSMMVFTAALDKSVKLWKRDDNNEIMHHFATIELHKVSCLCGVLHFLPLSRTVLLTIACDDSKIYLYTQEDTKFVKKVTLAYHRDFVWVMDITTSASGSLSLATGCQDGSIRLWEISACEEIPETKSVTEMQHDEKLEAGKEYFTVGDAHYFIQMDVQLKVHRGGVFALSWQPRRADSKNSQVYPLQLLSASMDRTAIIWTYNEDRNYWMDKTYLTELGTSNIHGFYGGQFSPDGHTIMVNGYLGTLHMWRYDAECGIWSPMQPFGGHTEEVVDISWEPKGDFLLSVSKDQTTRLHAPWIRSDSSTVTWHEMARPQVHGYDLTSVAALPRYSFVSGSEEKVIRIFRATKMFLENMERMSKVNCEECYEDAESIPIGATVGPLRLSNTVRVDADGKPGEFTAMSLSDPPSEERLLHHTRWPEMCKLYGHVFDVYSLASHPSGKCLASACKANQAEYAGIVIWNLENKTMQQVLHYHTLTVTQLQFSPSGEYLLAVSRDRCWSLYKNTGEGECGHYELILGTDKTYAVQTRMLWACCWTHDSKYFLTGSRDGTVVVWPCPSKTPVSCSTLELQEESVTAVACPSSFVGSSYIVAVGVERGVIFLYAVCSGFKIWNKMTVLDNNIAHHLWVNRIFFCPSDSTLLASCGADNAVKICNLSELYKALK